MRAQKSQPTEDMRIAAQLLEGADLSIMSAKVSQKKSNRSAISCDG